MAVQSSGETLTLDYVLSEEHCEVAVSHLERAFVAFIFVVIVGGAMIVAGCASTCDSYCCQSEITCTHEEDCE